MHLKKISWALLTILLGAAVLTGQISQPVWAARVAEQHTPDNEAESHTAVLDWHSPAISTISQTHLPQELYPVREIELNEDSGPQPLPSLLVPAVTQHFRILFSRVISPNAP